MGLARLLQTRQIGGHPGLPTFNDPGAAAAMAGGGRIGRTGPQPPPTTDLLGAQFPAAVAVNRQLALGVPAFWRGHAYVCGLGGLPFAAFRDNDAVDPQPAILTQPDPRQTGHAFWSGLISALTLYGNSVNIITGRDRLGYPTSLAPINPLYAAVRFKGNPAAPDIGGWYLAGRWYDPDEVWHVKSYLAPTGWPLGYGLLDAQAAGIAMVLSTQNFAQSFFTKGGVPNGVLKLHLPSVSQEQADEAKANWISKFAGTSSVAVMNELTDFTPIATNPVDSQMIEARQLDLISVALMWGIPPSKLGANVSGSTYKNAEMEEVQARNDAMTPWARLIEAAASDDLLPRGQAARWDLDAGLRTDTLSRFQAYQVALGGPGPQSAWLLPDEVREYENLDPMADELADAAQAAIAAGQPLPPALGPGEQPPQPGASIEPDVPMGAPGPPRNDAGGGGTS
jgi:HK97 family phage portal protein